MPLTVKCGNKFPIDRRFSIRARRQAVSRRCCDWIGSFCCSFDVVAGGDADPVGGGWDAVEMLGTQDIGTVNGIEKS